MRYRDHDGIRMSEIGVGCYGLSGAYGDVDVEAYKATLRRAYELGVTVFDAAEAYGDAERVLGEVVRPFRHDVLVATKVGVREGLKPNLSAAYVTEACEASLRRLGMACIDLYQVHFDDPDTPVAETIGALEGLIKVGKIRRYGVGHLPLPRVIQYMEEGDVFSVLMEFSAVARGAREQLLPLCEERDVAAIAFSVTGRGLLTGRFTGTHLFPDGDIRQIDPLFQRERFRSGLRVADKLAELGARYGRTPAQTAIAWVLAQPGVTCALTGPSSIDHLEENLAASGWTIPDEELADLDAWLDRERRRLTRAQRSSVSQILAAPLPADPEQAFHDLVYVMETAILLDEVAEREVLPLFHELFALRDGLGPDAGSALTDIQARLGVMMDARS